MALRIESNWQFVLFFLSSFPSVSNHISAIRSLHQLPPPHRGSSCTLHPRMCPLCPGYSAAEVRRGGGCVCLKLIHCWLISHIHWEIHTHTHISPSSPLLSLARTLERQRRRQAEESGMAASGCRQAVVIWPDYQPGGNIQPLYSCYSSSSSSLLCPSIIYMLVFSFFNLSFLALLHGSIL